MFIRLNKIICILIPISILLTACGPHIAEVVMPANGDYAEWLTYYEDQFEAYGDEVEVPTGEVLVVQMQAYEEAKDSYDSSVTLGWILGGVALAIGVGVFVATLGDL